MAESDITIPPGAEEAVADRIWQADFPDEPWVSVSELTKRTYRELARAACLAMLKAWPGAHEARSQRLDRQVIILPLSQEPGA